MPTFTGVVERCDLCKRKPFNPEYYNPMPTERWEWYLDVAVRLEDGSSVYFKTPPATQRISACPGAAIVTFRTEGAAADWMAEDTSAGQETRRAAIPGVPNNNSLKARVNVGDTIAVEGRVKAERTSKAGRPYKTITHARRIA